MWLAETWIILWYCAATEGNEDKQNVAPSLSPKWAAQRHRILESPNPIQHTRSHPHWMAQVRHRWTNCQRRQEESMTIISNAWMFGLQSMFSHKLWSCCKCPLALKDTSTIRHLGTTPLYPSGPPLIDRANGSECLAFTKTLYIS